MPVVERKGLQTKVKNVAKKSTTKKPQLWNTSNELKERDITTVSLEAMDSSETSNVYEETLDSLKALNGASVKAHGDNCDTELKILSTESVVQDNGLLDKISTEDALEHVSTDEEDNLLNLSDTEVHGINNEQINKHKNTDSASQSIGVQVRNSVRDIMSKLVQDGSPEVNKILAKPKGEDSFRANSPKALNPNPENKSEMKAINKTTIKENLFEIMSAESESDDMLLDSSHYKSTIVSVEVGEDTNISSVSMETSPQSISNTQDNTISSLFLSGQNSVSNSVIDSISADDSNILSDFVDNSVSATNSGSSVDFSDKASDIVESVHESNSNSSKLMTRKLESDQDNVISYAAIDISNEPVTSNLRMYNFGNPLDNPISDKIVDKSNDVENSEQAKEANRIRKNLEKVDMEVCTDIASATALKNSDKIINSVILNKVCEIRPKSVQLYDDISDSYDSGNDKPNSLKLDSKLSTYSDDDILDLNEDFDSPRLENSLDEKVGDVSSEKDKPQTFSVTKKDEDDKPVDEKGDNENNMVIGKSEDLGFGLEVYKRSSDKTPKEKEESAKVNNINGIDDKQNLKDGEGFKIKDSKSESMDVDSANEVVPETKCDVVNKRQSNCGKAPKHESMDTDNINEVKQGIKNDDDMEKEEKTNFVSNTNEKLDIKINQDIKDDKSNIKVDSDSKNNVTDEKPETIDIGNDYSRLNSTSKGEPSTTSGILDIKYVSKQETEIKLGEIADIKTEIVTERKRSGESPSTESQAPPKRSRLDIMIGKLGSQIGIAPESVPDPIDCDTLSESETESKEGSDDAKSEDEETKSIMEDDDVKTIYEEVKKKDSSGISTNGATLKEKESSVKTIEQKDEGEAVKELTNDLKSEISAPKKTESVSLQEEVNYSATTISDDDDDDDVKVIEEPIKSADAIQQLKNQDISYDSDMNLDQIIRKRVLQLIKSYRDETIAALQTKINILTKSTEKWKNTSKDLQKQVVDLTIVQQRLDKRKAATAALKSITSRSIGCQVDTTKLQNGSDVMKSPPKPGSVKYTSYTTVPPNAGQSMVSMIKQPPRPTVTAPVVNNMSQLLSATAESRNTNINNVRQGAGVSSVRNLLETTGRANITQSSVSTSTAKNVSYSGKVIDLTADEENTKKLSNSQAKAPIMVPVSNLPLGSAPLPGLPPGASILLSGPSGTQIVNHQFNKMSGALQVVTVSSGSQIRPGQFLTVVPTTATTTGNIRPQPVTMTTTIPSVTSIGTTPIRQTPPTNTASPPTKKTIPFNHPAPLPLQPINRTPNGGVKGLVPPKPDLKISRVSQGIVLSWTITQNLSLYSEIASYQLFAYQEGATPPHSNLWKKVGDVKALPLPMACTLTQFQEGNKYHFAVRAIDVYQRISDFSEPSSIHLFAL